VKDASIHPPVHPQKGKGKDTDDGAEAHTKKKPSAKELEKRVLELESELASTKDTLLRTQADYQNLLSRSRREVEKEKAAIKEKILLRFTEPLENLERALAELDAAKGEGAESCAGTCACGANGADSKDGFGGSGKTESLASGVRLVASSLESILRSEGLEPISTIGEKFDHNRHHAIMRTETPDHEEDTVVAEIKKGYRVGDKVVQPALVVVAVKPKAEDARAESGTGGADECESDE